MASTKRKSAGEEEHHPLNKRHKRGSSVSKKTEPGSCGEVIPIERLAWRNVSLPDRLEDAEGFFGLEEIENVEIVRDTHSGTIVYKVRKGLRNSYILPS